MQARQHTTFFHSQRPINIDGAKGNGALKPNQGINEKG